MYRRTKDGRNDAVNDLSFMVLKSVAQLKLTQPNLSVRYHKGVSNEFMKDCIEMIKLGFGMPSFNSDEIIIDQFINKGVSREDAKNYSSIGCIEVSIPGKFGVRCSGMNFMNFPRILMIALNQGVDVTSGEKMFDTDAYFPRDDYLRPSMAGMDGYGKILYTDQCGSGQLCGLCTGDGSTGFAVFSISRRLFERGLHLKEGGAVYDFIGPLQVGIANLGDSLAAIKKLVFEEKRDTPTTVAYLDHQFSERRRLWKVRRC